VTSDSGKLCQVDNPADANLIAAAPEMLEVLHLAHEVLWNGFDSKSEYAKLVRSRILKCINKAEGNKL
jgi:hypothetical protein